ncbi:DUF5672 family protein [Pseudorhodoferax sp.]|uniref:DUF5672 family protein n=1 Tax=Pseudorhodoferax sp. TaxID=1993553 RepID=UPI002DD685DF|nr:DUF5672 family protein [Pseudorhodoferax sp.]
MNPIVLVPVYRPTLPPLEQYSLDLSLAALAGRPAAFVAPHGLDRRYYQQRYPQVAFAAFDDAFFASIPGYNRLLLDVAFYQRFAAHSHLLILQTDAVVLRDELDAWCAAPYDYLGAPWPDGHELFVNLDRFGGANGKRMKVHVGNGGLSLRRIDKCTALLREFPQAATVFCQTGSNEDLFFAFMGALSGDFVLPGEIAASRFAMELRPSYYLAVNGGHAPMGGHAWWKYEPGFWKALLPASPLLDGM